MLGDPSILIALIDGPVDLGHKCFSSANLEAAKSWMLPRPQSFDLVHGTYTASLIFGQPGSPVSGSAPKCSGLLIPVFEASAGIDALQCDEAVFCDALILAAKKNAAVINISAGKLFSASSDNIKVWQAIQFCLDSGILIVAAAGNDGCDCSHVPASHPGILAVGASDENGCATDFTNIGDAYIGHWLTAPGRNVLVAAPGGRTVRRSGTSFASATVAGVAGTLLSMQKRLSGKTNTEIIKRAMLVSADRPRLQSSKCRGYKLGGRLNQRRAEEVLLHWLQAEVRTRLKTAGGSSLMSESGISKTNHDPAPELIESAVMRYQPDQPESTAAAMDGGTMHGSGATPTFGTLAMAPGSSGPVVSSTQAKDTFRLPLASGDDRLRPSSSESITTSACCAACAGPPEWVFVVGRLGFDFINRTNRNTFIDLNPGPDGRPRLPNPDDPVAMFHYLSDRRLTRAERLTWTLEVDDEPIYAIEPSGAFARDVYEKLVAFLGDQEIGETTLEGEGGEGKEKAERIILPGYIEGKTVLYRSGKEVDVVRPDVTDLANFSIQRILGVASQQLREDIRADSDRMGSMRDFMAALFDELRNPGRSSADRAKNFVSTSVAQALVIFGEAVGLRLAFESVAVSPSRIRPEGTDRWDVKLSFFAPQDQLGTASSEYTITVDVNYVLPQIVTIGPRRAKPTRVVVSA